MSFRFLRRPKWIAWTLVVVVAVVTMVNLGRWQYSRHLGRLDANEVIEARMDEPVVPIGELLSPEPPAEAAASLVFRRVQATGTYDVEHQVLVANRSLDGLAGWWVVTPLVLGDGTAVAVNRGFVPRDVTPEGPWDEFAPPTGEVTVEGILQASQDRRAGPLDDPRTLPRLHVGVLDERVPADLAPLWLQLEAQAPPPAGALPRTLPVPELSAGSHLSYTGQWLIFSLLTVVVYGALVVRTARRGDGSSDAESTPTSGTIVTNGTARASDAPPWSEPPAGATSDPTGPRAPAVDARAADPERVRRG